MNITIFGATGKSGKFIVREAIRRGHTITAFVRDPTKLGELASQVRIVQGDVADSTKVLTAVQGATAVISALGYVKGAKPGFQTEAMRNIIYAMQQVGTKRLVDLTGAGVRATGDNPGLIDTITTKVISILSPERFKDGVSHAELIRKSNLDWTIVRTPVQTNSIRSDYTVGKVGDAQLKLTSPRGAIAKFILDSIEQRTYVGQLPVATG